MLLEIRNVPIFLWNLLEEMLVLMWAIFGSCCQKLTGFWWSLSMFIDCCKYFHDVKVFVWLANFFPNDTDSEFTISTSWRKPLVRTLLEANFRCRSDRLVTYGLSWRLGCCLRRQLPMQQLTRFWKLGGISMSFRLAFSSNIWFGQMRRHLVWDCKAKESATPFFCCDSMGFTTVSTEPTAANSHTCGQSRGVKEQSKEHRIFCPCVERWKTRRTKGKDSTKNKKGNRMEEIINFPSRSRAIPFTFRISLRRRSLLSGWALLIGAFQ